MTILQDLFHGNITPDDSGFDRNSKYGRAMQAVAEHEERLLALINDEEKSLFISFRDAQAALNGIAAEENFILGFRIGARIMIEVIEGRMGI